MLPAKYSKSLNEEQTKILLDYEGVRLILAVPGSGKTHQMTHQVAYLVECQKVSPDSILMLTFTRNAAKQMTQRMTKLIGKRAYSVRSGNFHSFCSLMLRQYGKYINISSDYSILANEAETLFKRVAKEENVDLKQLGFTFGIYSRMRVNHKMPNETSLRSVIRKYQSLKLQNNQLDFDDLELYFHKLIHETKIGDILADNFKYIFVDESQDTNTIEFEIVKRLAAKHGNISIYGDEKQSIYKFRGSNVQNIIDFGKSFPNAKYLYMTKNYRCSPELALAANVIASHCNEGYEKNIVAVRKPGKKGQYHIVESTDRQAAAVSMLVKQYIDLGAVPREINIIYRTNFMSNEIETALTARGIRYIIKGDLSFFGRSHIKDCIAFINVMVNIKDAVSWERLLLMFSGVGRKTAEDIIEKIQKNSSYSFNGGSKVVLSRFSKLLIECSEEENCSTSFNSFLKFYLENMIALKYGIDENIDSRKQDLNYFLELMNSYKTFNEAIDGISFMSDKSENKNENDDTKVVLMTIHKAKGLESDIIIIPSVTDGCLPYIRLGDDEGTDFEEERRLFYVGITRARRRLHLIRPTTMMYFGRKIDTYESRFIRELLEANAIDLVTRSS